LAAGDFFMPILKEKGLQGLIIASGFLQKKGGVIFENR